MSNSTNLPVNTSVSKRAGTRGKVENFKQEFCPQLMTRLFPLVKWITDCKRDIVLLINIIDRRPGREANHLIYGGLKDQFKFLNKKDKQTLKVEKAIEKLSDYEIPLGEGKVASKLYKEFEDGKLALKEIEVGKLDEYFKSAEREGKGELTNEQALEYPILAHFFDIDKDHYLSLPLIQFGDFDGVVHIIFQSDDLGVFNTSSTWKHLIRHFSMEYESLLLNWDLVGKNIEKKSLVREQLNYLKSVEYEQAATTNPIFRELKYRQYYEESYDFLLKRVDQNDIIPERFKNEHRRRAIISILIDSYAHNISAHSLTVLKWWFQQRAHHDKNLEEIKKELTKEPAFATGGSELRDYLAKKFPDEYNLEAIEEGIKMELARWINTVKKRRQFGDYLPVRDQLLPLAEQLHPLFRFLLEKGAFWSGVTRDQQFGGEIRNLYDVLWNDFINNPLYLGTIAYSEKITKLNIHIQVYSGRKYTEGEDDFKRTYELDSNEEGVPIHGVFARINVGGVEDKALQPEYIKMGEQHELIRQKLEKCEVFLPGGVVGKHALFTLIENEIRNVKHFPIEDLEKMRKNGLNLFIAIRPGNLSFQPKQIRNRPLYKIGIWLGHKTKLYSQNDHLVIRRLEWLNEDIITPDTNQARLA